MKGGAYAGEGGALLVQLFERNLLGIDGFNDSGL